MDRVDEQPPKLRGGNRQPGADFYVINRKTYYHIEVDREKAAPIWTLLSEKYNAVILKIQHSSDGKDLNIHLRIVDKK